MSGNGNGNGKGRGKKTIWNLAKDGILWKRVLEYATKEFQEQAEAFVAQLQESVQPADALQGVLLDRMAAAYLRKHLIIEGEAAIREYYTQDQMRKRSGEPEAKRVRVVADSLLLQAKVSTNIMRYESLLDQGFHRDMILLQKLKEIAPGPDAGDRKPLRPERALIEGAELSEI